MSAIAHRLVPACWALGLCALGFELWSLGSMLWALGSGLCVLRVFDHSSRQRSDIFCDTSYKVPHTPKFSFGVIADVQWVDADDGWNYKRTAARYYRGALTVLGRAVDWWCEQPSAPAFIAQLGDLIDGMNKKLDTSSSALDQALSHLERAPCPTVNVIGNHDLVNFKREELAVRLGTAPKTNGGREFYAFSPEPGWKVLVLDSYQEAVIGLEESDPRQAKAKDVLAANNPNLNPSNPNKNSNFSVGLTGVAKRFVPFNGALGSEQLSWMRKEIKAAAQSGERVVVLSHALLNPEACSHSSGGSTLVWDYPEALDALQCVAGCVVAVLCGHDHNGNYHKDGHGVHHLTFCSPLNKGAEGCAFGLVQVYEDRLELRGPRLKDLLPESAIALATGGLDKQHDRETDMIQLHFSSHQS